MAKRESLPINELVTPTGQRITFGTAAPTTQYHKVGDMVINTAPSAGAAFAWTCSVAGTPGTWIEPPAMASVTSTAAELTRATDVSTRVINETTASLTVTELAHSDRTIVLDRAAGIAVTLPAASAGLKFRFIIKTTFSGAATIKSVSGADIMIGYALMGNDTNDNVVSWQAIAASTIDTIDMLGTGNSTGGMAGQEIEIEGLATNLWYVKIVGDAAGTEATPFANTVA